MDILQFNLTMFRHQQYESRLVQPPYHDQAPFFREAISLIDECTKLVKEDRILLRNRIKEYLRELRENRVGENQDENEQVKVLIQIFVEANRKRSLAKIQKGDKVMDWLQIKLRKFVDGLKKQRHRREVENFRRGKYIDVKKYAGPVKDNNASQSRQRSQPFCVLGPSRGYQNGRLSGQNNSFVAHSSLSKSRDKDGIDTSRKRSQNHSSYSSYSFHKNFTFAKRGSRDMGVKEAKGSVQAQRIGNKIKQSSHEGTSKMNKSLQHNNYLKGASILGKGKNALTQQGSKQILTKKQNAPARPNMQHKQSDIDKLTKLFSEQLNQEQSKQVANKKPSSSNAKNEGIPYGNSEKLFQLTNQNKSNTHNKQIDDKNMTKSIYKYEESSKKIKEMLDTSKHLLQQFTLNNSAEQKNESFIAAPQLPSSFSKEPFLNEPVFPKSHNDFSRESNLFNEPAAFEPSEVLFTPPQFLAQCRKFLSSSNKKRQSQQGPSEISQGQDYENGGKKLTFSNALRESRERKEGKITQLYQMGINEVMSQNVSACISTKKPESEVAFRFKNVSINSIQQLLLQIFKSGPFVSLDRYQLGQTMSKCSSETEKLLQKYCDVLSEQLGNAAFTFDFSFVAMVKYFFTYGKVLRDDDDHFSNLLCSILDMQHNGYVNQDQIDDFIESMQSSDIESELLQEIRELSMSLFRRCCQVEGGGSLMTRWSIYFFELKKDSELISLKQLLNNFDFQIDNDQ